MPVLVKLTPKITKPDPIEGAPPKYSDEWLARRFADQHEHDLQYVAKWARWFHFDGKRWRVDELLTDIRFAREEEPRNAHSSQTPARGAVTNAAISADVHNTSTETSTVR